MEEKALQLSEITSSLQVFDIKAFNYYLREIWISLIGRINVKEESDNSKNQDKDILCLDKLIFCKYYSLPGIIGDRLFRVFDSKSKNALEFNDFKIGMDILFCGNLNKNLRFIFDFYDFDGDGKISKEDIRTVLSYVTYTNETKKKI